MEISGDFEAMSDFEKWLADQVENKELKLNCAPRILMSVAYRAGHYQGMLDANKSQSKGRKKK